MKKKKQKKTKLSKETNMTFRIPTELLESLNELAEQEDMSVSAIIRRAVKKELSK